MDRGVVLAGLLATAIAAVGCETYRLEPTTAVARLAHDTPIYVSVPADGRHGTRVYPGSGAMTVAEVVAALSYHTRQLTSANAIESREQSVRSARAESAEFLVVPTILNWEDRATEWTGLPDRISIRLDLVDLATGAVVESRVVSGRSRWATLGGDHPQDLLPGALAPYANELFDPLR